MGAYKKGFRLLWVVVEGFDDVSYSLFHPIVQLANVLAVMIRNMLAGILLVQVFEEHFELVDLRGSRMQEWGAAVEFAQAML